MATPISDSDLLFGIAAFQMGFVHRNQLTSAIAFLDREENSLRSILVRRGDLNSEDGQFIDSWIDRNIAKNASEESQLPFLVPTADEVGDLWRWLGEGNSAATTSCANGGQETHSEISATVTQSGSPHEKGSFQAVSSSDRFQVLRHHARGGLGEVSVAFDRELEREVALKEIQSHFAKDEASRSRFLLEAFVTGRLEHPGIVPVYGLNRYTDGRPFYAMRFIRGKSLKQAVNEFYERHKHEGDQRRQDYSSVAFRKLLGGFIDVCQAIDFAHSKGVLHRDIKPSNVMLGGFGETLVVDWGLAKLTNDLKNQSGADSKSAAFSSLPTLTEETSAGIAMGTPRYMSPEQSRGDIDRLSPASDVYSLGATLFYLLTGESPFQDEQMADLMDSMQKGLFDPPSSIRPEVPGGLEAICLKAMSRTPQDRYTSARELASDIERWLADEPISVYQEPFALRAKRWMRKHPRMVGSTAASVLVGFAATLLLSAVVSTKNGQLQVANRKERDAKSKAERYSEQLELSRQEVIAQEKQVRQERDIAVELNKFVRNDLLAQASPDYESNRDITMRQILDRAAASIGERFSDNPLLKAAIAQTIGISYVELGVLDLGAPFLVEARDLRAEALGEDAMPTLTSRRDLALLYQHQGRYTEAEKMLQDLLVKSRQLIRLDDTDQQAIELRSRITNELGVLYTDMGEFSKAEEYLNRFIAEHVDHSNAKAADVALAYNNLAGLYEEQGRFKEARDLLLAAHPLALKQFGEQDVRTIDIEHNLAAAFKYLGDYKNAQQRYLEVVQKKESIFGERHLSTLISINGLSQLYLDLDQPDKAIPMLEELSARALEEYGDTHPSTLLYTSNLAQALSDEGLFERAEPMARQVLAMRRKTLGEEHPETLTSANNLFVLLSQMGRYAEAAPILEESLATMRRTLGDDHPNTLISIGNLGQLYGLLGDPEKAEPFMRESLENLERTLGRRHPTTLQASEGLVMRVLLPQQRFEEAVERLAETLMISREVLGNDHRSTTQVMSGLALVYVSKGEVNKAIPLFDEFIRVNGSRGRPNDPRLCNILESVARELLVPGGYETAERYLRQSLEIRSGIDESHWATCQTKAFLADALIGQGDHAGAATQLVESFEKLESQLDQLPEETYVIVVGVATEAVRQYEVLNRPEDAAVWRAKLQDLHLSLGYVHPPRQGVFAPRVGVGIESN